MTSEPVPLPVGGTGRDRAGWGRGKFVQFSIVLFPRSHQLLISCRLPSSVQRPNLIGLCFSLLVPFLFFKNNIVCINKMPKEMKVKWQEGVFFNCLGVCVCVCVFWTSLSLLHLSGVGRPCRLVPFLNFTQSWSVSPLPGSAGGESASQQSDSLDSSGSFSRLAPLVEVPLYLRRFF